MEKAMKRLFMAAAAALTLLLSGCATTISSDVTTFHQWPAQMEDKSYAFEAASPQEDTLELRSYQDLVRAQLARLGFHDAGTARPALLVAMHFTTTDVPVRMIEPLYPMTYYPSARFRFMGPRRHNLGSFYSPFYDPFWDPFPAYRVVVRHQYQRELQVGIKSAVDGKRLFDVTVHNASEELSTPKIMPALVQSAFEGFPGPNGGARRVELQEKKG
jgi:hypothetical protein